MRDILREAREEPKVLADSNVVDCCYEDSLQQCQ